MGKTFDRRGVVTGAPFMSGALLMIPESGALENTRGGETLFWTAFVPAAVLGATIAYGFCWRKPAPDQRGFERIAEFLILALGVGLLCGTAASCFNHLAVSSAPRNVEVPVLDRWKTRTSDALLVDWEGVHEELDAPADAWARARPGASQLELVVVSGRLGYEFAKSIHHGRTEATSK
jgi:hypothetical protein